MLIVFSDFVLFIHFFALTNFSIFFFSQYYIMALYYSPDNLITATEGDLIEFRRLLFFGFGYRHFAVCTVDSEADCLTAVQTSRAVGDR